MSDSNGDRTSAAITPLVGKLQMWANYRSGLKVPGWSSSVVRHNLAEAASLIKSLHADRDLLVRALREYAADRSDEDIAFDFDAPGARLHEQLKRILSEVPNGS